MHFKTHLGTVEKYSATLGQGCRFRARHGFDSSRVAYLNVAYFFATAPG